MNTNLTNRKIPSSVEVSPLIAAALDMAFKFPLGVPKPVKFKQASRRCKDVATA